jgi:hypothetical protein
MNLLEIGKDFEIIRRGTAGRDGHGQLKPATFKITIKRSAIRVKLALLKKKIKELQERYPDKNYYIKRIRYAGKVYWRFGRKEEKMKGIPLYYSTRNKKLYIPSGYVKRKYKLVCAVICYRLRDLGIPYHQAYSR